MYTIEIEYSTGNSYGTHQETDSVEFVWETLDDAKEALRRIKEHHEYYTRIRAAGRYAGYHGSTDTQESLLAEAKTKPWYVHSDYSSKGMCDFSLIVPTSDPEHDRLSVFWIGYFETLHGARIVAVNKDDDGMSFSL